MNDDDMPVGPKKKGPKLGSRWSQDGNSSKVSTAWASFLGEEFSRELVDEAHRYANGERE